MNAQLPSPARQDVGPSSGALCALCYGVILAPATELVALSLDDVLERMAGQLMHIVGSIRGAQRTEWLVRP